MSGLNTTEPGDDAHAKPVTAGAGAVSAPEGRGPVTRAPVSSTNPQFCLSCGASIPHRHGEGRCPRCVEHDPVWARKEIERLQQLLHDAGAAFTSGNVSCSTCRRVYNRLAADQGWARFPDEEVRT